MHEMLFDPCKCIEHFWLYFLLTLLFTFVYYKKGKMFARCLFIYRSLLTAAPTGCTTLLKRGTCTNRAFLFFLWNCTQRHDSLHAAHLLQCCCAVATAFPSSGKLPASKSSFPRIYPSHHSWHPLIPLQRLAVFLYSILHSHINQQTERSYFQSKFHSNIAKETIL